MTASPFDPEAELAFVRDVIQRKPDAVARFAQRLRCVPRFLLAQNARYGRPLDDHELEDLVGDVSLVVWRKLDQFAGHSPLEGWILKVCTLEFMNSMRRRFRRPGEFPEGNPDNLPGPAADSAVDAERVHLAVDRVGGVEAELIRMKHFEALSFDEIAARMRTSANTVKTRYYRGIVQLERILRSSESEGGE